MKEVGSLPDIDPPDQMKMSLHVPAALVHSLWLKKYTYTYYLV